MIGAQLASALRRTARIAIERPRTALWTLLALTCALFAVGVAALAATSVDRWVTQRPGAHASMVVYLGDATPERARALVGELRALAGVEHAELVPAEESARRLVSSLDTDAALLAGVDVATLPASIEVRLAPGVRDVVAMSPTVRALTSGTGVVDVVVEDPQQDEISGVLATVRRAAWTGAALFAGLALIVVLAATRIRHDRDGRELYVVNLLGGAPSFIIVPTALAGMLSGVAAALLAALALRVGVAVYGDALARTIGAPLATVAPLHVAMFVGIGAMLGLLGGALAGASRAVR